MTNQNNNNALALEDINKSFVAFADLAHQSETDEANGSDHELKFGEFAADSSVFPMI